MTLQKEYQEVLDEVFKIANHNLWLMIKPPQYSGQSEAAAMLTRLSDSLNTLKFCMLDIAKDAWDDNLFQSEEEMLLQLASHICVLDAIANVQHLISKMFMDVSIDILMVLHVHHLKTMFNFFKAYEVIDEQNSLYELVHSFNNDNAVFNLQKFREVVSYIALSRLQSRAHAAQEASNKASGIPT